MKLPKGKKLELKIIRVNVLKLKKWFEKWFESMNSSCFIASLHKKSLMQKITKKLSKELWKTLNSMGLPSKAVTASNIKCNKAKMKQCLMQQKTALSLKTIFEVMHKTWQVSYILHLIFLLNLKLHPTMQQHSVKELNFRLLETSPQKILSIWKRLNPSKAAGIDNLSGKF